MNSWKTREDRLILTLHPPFFSKVPYVHFYFPGSPLCFASRCLHLSVPSQPAISPMVHLSFLPFPLPLWLHPPVYRFSFLFQTGKKTEQKHILKNNRDFLSTHTPPPLSAFTCALMEGLLYKDVFLLNNFRYNSLCSIFPFLLFSPSNYTIEFLKTHIWKNLNMSQ